MKNKKITIYELMGLIKDDKAPKKIKYYGEIFKKVIKNKIINYVDVESEDIELNFEFIVTHNLLNNTLEILPEENDEWEDICELLDDSRYNFSDRQNGMTKEDRRLLDSNFKTLGETINQLIKNQKYLKAKLDKYDRED